ncbi:MAG: HD domain-containing protein [Vicinamibacterales bacterium]
MQLPQIAMMQAQSAGTGFYLCVRKDLRTGRNGGEFLAIVLQDISGEIAGKIFNEVDTLKQEFEAGEFVKVQARGSLYNQRLELLIEKIRRVHADRDRLDGFREEDCIRASPYAPDEMWARLEAYVAGVEDAHLRALLTNIITAHAAKLKIWPAAQTVHHAYRSGLLEHIVKLIETTSALAAAYGARRDLLVAGVILHDIGKLRELSYDTATQYSIEGNLIGHITLGAEMLRDAAAAVPDFPATLLIELEHMVLSHHGSKEFGSPVEPMTVEAFILATCDELDARLHQIHRHIAEDDTGAPFTPYHSRLKRVFFKSGGDRQ